MNQINGTGIEIPPGVGPHEGREFALMRDGKKHVAYFAEVQPVGLEKILSDGFCLLQFSQFVARGQTYFAWIAFREGHEKKALRLKALLKSGSGKGIVPSREHEIGKILSYTFDEVEAFIKHATRH